MEKPIKSYALPDLEELMAQLGQPRFRARQLADWLYIRHAESYDQMTNLPATLRARLQEEAPLYPTKISHRSISRDGTRKYVLSFHDGAQVETVAIPSKSGASRLTVCFSTQAGCAIGCVFCATGHEGFTRNLTPGEMADQILIAQEDCDERVTNVVAMGQGEPFLNYENTLAALHILNDSKGLAIGARRITVSTCGIIPGIERFSHEPEQFTLAVSLHAARQPIRDILMPAMAKYPLEKLKKSLQDYLDSTNRRITLEYLLIDGVNDNQEDLAALLSFCRGLHCHVNLLPMNRVDSSPFEPSSQETVLEWIERLERRGIETTLRSSRGADIAGACGQLKNSLR